MSKDGNRSIATNAVFNVLYKLLNALFPLITATYVSRVILPEGVGKVAYAQNIVMYFTYIAALGLPTYGTREIAREINSFKNRNRAFSELFLINFISTSVCSAVYLIMINSLSSFADDLTLHYVAGIAILLNFINVDWVYQGFEEFRYISIRSMIVKTISIIFIFAFVKDKDDFVIYAFIHCLAVAGNNVFNIIHLRKFVKFDFNEISITKHLKPLIILLSSSIAIELYTLVDTTMLGFFCQKVIVGYYSNAMKLVKIIITVLAALISVMLPRLSQYYKDKNMEGFNLLIDNTFILLTCLTLPCAVGLFSVSEYIIPVLFGNDFTPSIYVLRILCVLIIPIPFSTFIGSQVLCAMNLEKKMLISVTCGAIVNITLNSILIPKYQHNGAAIASVISEFVVFFVELVFLTRVVQIRINKKDVCTCLLSTTFMFFAVLVSKQLNMRILLQLLVSLITGLISYSIMMFLTRNNAFLSLISAGKKLIKIGGKK